MSTSASHAVDLAVDPGFVPGNSPAIQRVNATVREIAGTNIPVLLIGESGTGKEVYVRLIHRLSGHCHTPIKKLSCHMLGQEDLVVFVRAQRKESAEDNDLQTLFLDGIDELDSPCQRMLISVLSNSEDTANGTKRVRLLASASRNLDHETETGRFRRELYFRISGICLRLPPLRDRKDDIPALMEHFLARHAAELQREAPVLKEEQITLLSKHDWPGNVRELENVAKKSAALGDVWKALDGFQPVVKTEVTLSDEPQELSLKVAARVASRQAERELILKALERTHWNRKRAARDLQVSYKSLLYKIKQTGLEASKPEQLIKES